MVAFIVSLLLAAAMVAPIFSYAKKRPVGTTLTWGEAMLGAVYVFFIIFWIYGVVPHQWLTWADSELGWRPDLIWFGKGGEITLPFVGWSWSTPWFPIMVNARAVRDIIATVLYVVFLGLQMWVWGWWQNRGKRADAAKAIEPTSNYGRPLVKRA
ncbi:MAG: hypothetical protein WBA45_14025 [Microthrixaceae bacterium]